MEFFRKIGDCGRGGREAGIMISLLDFIDFWQCDLRLDEGMSR